MKPQPPEESIAFFENVPIDIGHTLDQLTSSFSNVKDGLPELVKNSKDQYSRLGLLEKSDRQIVVLVRTSDKSVGVLDFAGATAKDFVGWATWSSRTSGRSELGDDIEAGHGNGGKGFMVRGCTEQAFLESCFEKRCTRIGFKNNDDGKRYLPGYFREGNQQLNNIKESEPVRRLGEFLAAFGCRLESLPEPCKAAFARRQAFTGVRLEGVLDWRRRRKIVERLPIEIRDLLASHGQTVLTIMTCDVWVIVDGRLTSSNPVSPTLLEPLPGFEKSLIFPIPAQLIDPDTGENVDIGEAKGSLELSTSKRHLQMSLDLKARNCIRIWNSRNNVATWPLPSLGVFLATTSFIYGELKCILLTGEHLAGADRVHLADTPLVKALKAWVLERVSELAEAIQKAQMAEQKPKDKKQATEALAKLRLLMRKFLNSDADGSNSENGEVGAGTGGDDDDVTPPIRGERVDVIVLERERPKISLAQGTSIPFRFECFELTDGQRRPVRAPKVNLKVSKKGVVQLTKPRTLFAATAGETEVWLEDLEGSLKSNSLLVEVLSCNDVQISAPSTPVRQAERVPIGLNFLNDDTMRDDLFVDAHVDEPGMGVVNRRGMFTAGLTAGVATVRVKFGPASGDQKAVVIQISEERVPPPDRPEKSGGSDIPLILFCGDECPGMDDFPVESRTHPGGEHYPTIIEEPQFRNVVWINHKSREAIRVRKSRGGSSGIGGLSTQTFMHFIALKCFDILKRLHVRQQLRGKSVTEVEFIQCAALAEGECADFIDSAWELGEALLHSTTEADK